MCGIVGYLGEKNPKDVIVSGLKKLEYRGYDSAGVAIFDGSDFKRVRASGKLINLENKLSSEKFGGKIGIGHTRWATHGVPSESNAHPHTVEGVSIVHNGIIENYLEIREELLKEGAQITSETDSELVAHLIAKEIKQTKNLFKAVENVIPHLKGAYSILAVSKNEPEYMVAFKNGPPLVLGVGEKEMFVASDIQAVMSYTRKVVYLDDLEVALVKQNEFQVYDNKSRPLKKEVVNINWNPDTAEKAGFKHFMLKEVYEQPRTVAAAIEPHVVLDPLSIRLRGIRFDKPLLTSIDEEQDIKDTEKKLASVERVLVVACGTSYYAGMVGEYLIEELAKVPVEVEYASEFRYRKPVISKNTLVLIISQSGETADTLAALRMVKEQGVASLSICNVRNSSIDREASGHLYMRSDVEVGVASTKAFTCTLALLNLLAMGLAKAKGHLSGAAEQKLLNGLLSAPAEMEKVLAYDKFFAEAANTLKDYKGFLYLGRHVSFPIALEGALKLKELAYMHAEGYAAGEMKHGPIALIDQKMAVVVVAPDDSVYEKTLSNLEEVRARGGQVISIGSGENEKLKRLSLHYLALPEVAWNINPLLEVIPLQLLAYHVADALGHDVDQPRNLAKSVTVE